AVLRDEGWTVSDAASAEEAFDMLHEKDWTVVFCDVVLGGADGFSVLKRFKEELPQTKVVLMTGHGSASGALDATAYGAYDYLLKPFGMEELQSLSRAIRERIFQTQEQLPDTATNRVRGYQSDITLIGRSAAFI